MPSAGDVVVVNTIVLPRQLPRRILISAAVAAAPRKAARSGAFQWS